ncbi:NAD(P)/FAD-dependent oxidoreductase [Pseudokineococcus sp. 1T1Z-3]|uniref:NAD(P)/FAD-dependent oxidoreductase n=1 Tax=Pseudokineococcus sp. 1T1Z-3 TaxID=3132745 RepID=UPI0030AC783C
MSTSTGPASTQPGSTQPGSRTARRVVVVGGGVAGLASAASLRDGGADVVVLDRGRSPGGRLGLRRSGRGTPGERVVDVGASYFVPRATSFAALAASWQDRGLARPWADTFLAVHRGDDGRVTSEPRSGPTRWAAPGGLRSLTDDLAAGLDGRGVPVRRQDVRSLTRTGGQLAVDGEAVDGVVLAMPEPQAVRLLGPGLQDLAATLRPRSWTPVVTVWARWEHPWWPAMDGAFVAGSPAVDFVADDGRRRGDGAPVLVAHSTAQLARDHLGDPDAAVRPVLAELGDLLGDGSAPEPVETGAQRWTFARPDGGREETCLVADDVAVCGDGWGPRPGVEQAWLSGTQAGVRLAARLADAGPGVGARSA